MKNSIFLVLSGAMIIATVAFTNPHSENQESTSELSEKLRPADTTKSKKLVNTTPVAKPVALVNYDYFETLVAEVKQHRSTRLLSLDSFLLKSQEPRTVILDTRSQEMYDLKHVKGAIHLDFSDFTQQALDNLMQFYVGRETQILIYCNNNFFDSQAQLLMLQDLAFVSKASYPIPKDIRSQADLTGLTQTLALNIPTYINLYGYGFKNVFELKELVDVNDPRIEFEGTFDDLKERN